MKKTKLFILFMIGAFCMNLSAQNDQAFSRLGGSLSLGTTGAELELSTCLHPKLYLRGGIGVLPFNYTITVTPYSFNGNQIPGNEKPSDIDLDSKVRIINGKILVDYFPTNSIFFITGGLYMSSKTMVKLEGESEYDLEWDNFIIPSENGRVRAQIRTNPIKPYLGIGVGNTIPSKRFGFRFEAGAMFHGTPGVYNIHNEKLENINVNSSDISHTIRRVKVYPVVAFRLTGRII